MAKKTSTKAEDLLIVPDGWKPPKFTPEDNPHGVLVESEHRTYSHRMFLL